MENYLNKIIHGDCLQVMKQLPDKCIDLVLTDIPYNISQESNGLREIDYGDWDKNISPELVLKWVQQMIRLSKNGVYIFCGDEQFSDIFKECKKNDLITRKYEWLKTNPNIMNGQHFWLSSGELCVCAKTRGGYFKGNCEKAYKISTAPTDRVHPNQKPIEILKNMLEKSSKEGDIILDPFLGSGTTAVACKDLKRNFIGIETSKEYCDIAQKRLDACTQVLF